ncbi:PfkB family carbohydrate kinase [Antarctobacter sp.]|uniref:PfkB family carbohydrate kinase n=1 Tax=Antarctobacter sp. TaxID=1872577 RepID=UPI002B274004|nr:PfkB family carbohydrate kinase [Antarctobacter sp.]
MTTPDPDILCIGSVLWDVIGRCADPMLQGNDKPGRITRVPGGVALNIAMTLAGLGMRPALLSVVGRDAEGAELAQECRRLGLDTTHLTFADDLPTDRYMAIEAPGGLVAAIADAHSLEAAGARILSPLTHGPLGHADRPYTGLIALDGNLTEALLTEIAALPAFAMADLRIAPASPGKATRLHPFLGAGRGTLYVNLEEACLLCAEPFTSAAQAAAALVARGASRALVTHGGNTCCDACAAMTVTQTPPAVTVTRITGAGDTFMAAHIAAERVGMDRPTALRRALDAAATYVSGDLST